MMHGWTARVVAVLVLAGGVAGCAGPTSYHPAEDGRGYAEQALEADRYRVTFSGNSLTSRETVENYLLYRAAEVTLAQGYDHFVVVDQDTERHTTYRSTFSGVGGYGGYGLYGPLYGPYYAPYYGPGAGGIASASSWPRDSYTAYANIVMRRGAKPADDANAYDARAVIEEIGPTVTRPSPES